MNQPIVGTRVNCGNPDHVSPFRVLSDLLCERILDYLVWGPRAGSKTYLFGGLDTYYKCVTKKKYEVKILGGSEGQAQYSYDAIKDFSDICDPDSVFIKDLRAKKGTFADGSSASILTASSKSVRGPHPQCLKLDEVDEIDPQVYEDALSQPQEKHGHPAVLGMFSTNHNINGQMDAALKTAKEQGSQIYKYCCWEIMESCRDYTCSTCKLSGFCPGPATMKNANGYYKIADLIKKLTKLSWGSFARDWLCTKVGTGDAVYDQEWNEDIHIVSVQLREAPVVLSLDFGGVDPFTCGVWQKAPDDIKFDKEAWIRITELYLTSTEKSATNPQFIKLAKAAPWARLVKEIIPDSGRPDLIQEWRTAFPNAKITLANKKSIDEGIEATKDALRPILGSPKILVNRICLNTRREMQMYKVKNAKPVDKDNHTPDDIRYFVMAKVRRVETSYFGTPKADVMPE